MAHSSPEVHLDGGWRVVLAGVGADAHSVGLTVLREALCRAGYEVDFLGTQRDVAEICERAASADIVMVSNMDGHARYYLQDLVLAQWTAGTQDRLWFLGGYPALDGDATGLEELGFDRVFQGYAGVELVLDELARALVGRRPGGYRPAASTPSGDDAAVPPPLHESNQRDDVLYGWRTGAAARNLAENAQRMRSRARLADHQSAAADRGKLLIQPRTGVSSTEGQFDLFSCLRAHGADVLSFQVDSLTRNNQYDDIERILKGSTTEAVPTSQLNGYPVVNLGMEAMARLSEHFSDIPLQVRHSTRDPRLLAEITFGAGVAAFEGGALSYNLPYFRDYPIAHAVRRWRYVDSLAGRYYHEFDVKIDREFFGVLTACMVPPCIAIAVNVFEALLAAECGVKSVSLGYAEQGYRAQDLAAVRALKRLASTYLDRAGFDDVAVHVVWHQYMGPFPTSETKAYQILKGSAISAARSGAVRLMLKSYAEAIRIPTVTDNKESLQYVRDTVHSVTAAPELTATDHTEEDLIAAEVSAILDHALAAAHDNTGLAVEFAIRNGWLDTPFSPSRWNAGQLLPLRDSTGAVRIAIGGRLPLPKHIWDFHRDELEKRFSRDGRDVALLLEKDVSATARGEFDDWPLG